MYTPPSGLPPPPAGYVRLPCMICEEPCIALKTSHDESKAREAQGSIVIITCHVCQLVVEYELRKMLGEGSAAQVRKHEAPDPEADPALKAYIEETRKAN